MPRASLRSSGRLRRMTRDGAATMIMRKPMPSTKRVASSTAISGAAAPARLAAARRTSPARTARRSPQRPTSPPIAMPVGQRDPALETDRRGPIVVGQPEYTKTPLDAALRVEHAIVEADIGDGDIRLDQPGLDA